MANLPVEWVERPVRAPKQDRLTKREVCAYLEIGPGALDDLIAQRRFPGPIEFTPKTKRWKWEWVVGYIFRLDMDRWLKSADEVAKDSPDSTAFDRLEPPTPASGRKRPPGPTAD